MKKQELEKVKNKVNNRIVGIMSHGASIVQLERTITEYKNYDICWCSFNLYSVMQDYILSKINKHLEIILECSASNNREYEEKFRIPNMVKYLFETHPLFLSTGRLMTTQYEQMKLKEFYTINQNDIVLVDCLFDRLDYTPNSLFLLLATVAVGNPKKIIVFGMDGCKDPNVDQFSTYYKSELQRERIKALIGTDKPESSLDKSTKTFEERFDWLYPEFCKRCGVEAAEIINCSDKSLIKSKWFKKINYDELRKEL